jgi:hypothetical protein
MIKVSMLAALLAGLAMGGNIAHDSRPQKAVEPRDTQIIVEVNRSLESLTKQGVKNVQNIVYNTIKQNVTRNVEFITSYSVLNNAFAISINSKYVDNVKSLPGVKSVTVNKMRFVKQSVTRNTEPEHDPVTAYGGKVNQSAITMNYDPYTNDTKAGEGTVIAILDNEFYFRGAHDGESGFEHETFAEFKASENVNVRWSDRPDITKTHAYSPNDDEVEDAKWHAIIDAAKKGDEGSLYHNNKVPFYFDYGGDPDYTGGDYEHDFDVSSTRDYHGSHVASIASGHALNEDNTPRYFGIAPKAQLVCMKVFTNFKANKTDLALGFQGRSGAYDIPILQALEDCITLGVDGINMSLGSDLTDFDGESITMKTLTKLHEAGILSSISAGNSGKTSFNFAGGYGNWTGDMVETGVLGGYANQVDSMSIASAQPGKTFYKSAFRMPDGTNIGYQDQVVNVGSSLDYEEDEERRISDLIEIYGNNLQWEYIPGYGSSTDYGSGSSKKDVSGKIAIVNRGNIDFATKVQVAIDKEAIGLVIINNDPTASDFNFRCSFGEYKPTIPVALVLMKDKEKFSTNTESVKTFTIVKDEVDDNPKANTLSDFSSDGATFDLDLKPEIAAPGDSIRGAVPPQSKEDRQLRPLCTYEFLSGTSMSAPNYAGAQSVVLSKKASDLRANEDAFKAYSGTVDMRLMSTATPMKDYVISPEINPSYPLKTSENKHEMDDDYYGYESSPRIQGAGMVNLGNAYKTDVYLEGLDLLGNPIGKSKIALRNNDKINKGTVSLSFLAHNEASSDKRYSISYSVMRPAMKKSNEIVPRNYNLRPEVDTFSLLPGYTFYTEDIIDGQKVIVESNTKGTVAVGDVFKVTRELKYFTKAVDPETGSEYLKEESIPIGRYHCKAVEEREVINPSTGKTEIWPYATYEDLEPRDYQSTQDTMITVTSPVTKVVAKNSTTTIELPEFDLPDSEKQKILDFYSYGTYLEGYVTLHSLDDNIDLSIPWMGFFAGEGKSYNDAEVAEPFGFEKDANKVYPSELVNDIGRSLVGKNQIDMGSTWATTYVEPGKEFNSDNILSNDQSLTNLADPNNKQRTFNLLGTDLNGNYYENAKDNLYVGNPIKSNTMIIQQFMLRSVDDNYYTIKNKATGKVVSKDVLEDMLFGEEGGKYPLYKSHVDGGYLSGGYIAHRAWGVIPLYDSVTGAPFDAGDYEITFNYLLSGTKKWISKSYTLHVASIEPSISSVSVLENSVRFYYQDKDIVSITVGQQIYQQSDAEINGRYIELSKERIEFEIQTNWNRSWFSGRLYIELRNKAYGRTGIIVRFNENDDGELIYSQYSYVEHYSFIYSNDFEDLGNVVNYVTVDGSAVTPISVDDYVRIKRYDDPVPATGGGCGGNISTTSILLASLAGALAIIIAIAKSRRKSGGKE